MLAEVCEGTSGSSDSGINSKHVEQGFADVLRQRIQISNGSRN